MVSLLDGSAKSCIGQRLGGRVRIAPASNTAEILHVRRCSIVPARKASPSKCCLHGCMMIILEVDRPTLPAAAP